MTIIYYLIFTDATIALCNAIWRPRSPEFLSSLVVPSDEWTTFSVLLRMGNAVFQAYVVYTFHENSILYLYSMFTVLASTADIISS